MSTVRAFMDRHFLHFNSREVVDAAKAYEAHIKSGGKMMVTLAGAMSTARIGRILGRLIRQGYVHAICCTGANLEEDVFNLLAANDYKIIQDWRALRAEDEKALYDQGYNRVTDTCIPETIMRHLEERLIDVWSKAAKSGERKFESEFLFEVLGDPSLEQHYQIPKDDSWMLAAKEMGIPVYSPGWEDSTTGNMFAAACWRGDVSTHTVVKTGTEQMEHLMRWYLDASGYNAMKKQGASKLDKPSVGFFQIGGGIAGDFAICAVPAMIQDLEMEDCPFWGYFAQISDAVTSYGGYSGAVPNEKITWGKLEVDTPKYMIQSDATIVAPLIFAYLLGE
ncbi:deoxyhypusine synthase family protein [Sandaracinus amylolyticus]|uniref:deoxyhypusine synthase family protein n=1 Tax=Sandaracinus amylolyticus TaxID=927083 RepID=UPI001F3145AB|nr:deoxyhypusine synthase family protein [Sandaracinus amylolyticus]UJR84967.1 HssIII [Sandaracinus amylolyticus]